MVAFELFGWRFHGGHIYHIRQWSAYCGDLAASRRVSELLSFSSGIAAQGAAVVDTVRGNRWRCRLVVLGSEAMGEGHMAVIRLTRTNGRPVEIFVNISTTESAPHDQTRTVVMRVLGDQLGGKVWWRG